MDPTTLPLLIAILAGWVSLNCGLVVIYLLFTGESLNLSFGFRKRAPRKQAGSVAKASTPDVDSPVLVDENAGAWGLFVMFDDPTLALNERLGILLGAAGAVYESSSKSFTVAGESPRNPIYIANAYPPGRLPSFNNDNGQFPIKGVSVKMLKKSSTSTPNKLQLVRLVNLSKELARAGGKVVDAEKQPVTASGLQAVIDGNAKV
ncbi:hypothetical protein QC823_08585 [Halomonas vilamensis]|uniref:Uncharacterized protein n=1 Tax=Vreelandella vilamensis TaxID=531309 RepID=A0ABU1H407_9GAMM|nr:hypothetical protein [Halomonas vilamensis]MDR5899043.1 hypothetical protein [Halomonas vilamensis]